jgi:hypothetical protein
MKRFLVALALGTVVLGGVTAFAASLGGVTSRNLGAGAAVIASCDTDGIRVNPNEGFSSTGNAFEIRAVHLSDVAAACDGKTVSIYLTHGTDTLGFTGGQVHTDETSTPSGQVFNVLSLGGDGTVVRVEDVTQISVLIS